jgi:hypothetical protein
MKRPLLFLVAALAAAVTCCGATTHRSSMAGVVERIWMRLNGPWESPPPEIGIKERTAPATLMRFGRNGEFSIIIAT